MGEITALTVIDLKKSVKNQINEDKDYLREYFTERQLNKLRKELEIAKDTKVVKLAFVFAQKRHFRNKIVVRYMMKGE